MNQDAFDQEFAELTADQLCPFCARIAAEDFAFARMGSVVFEPLNPVTPGHLLVVPRKHVAHFGLDRDTDAFTMLLAAELVARDGDFNVITSKGPAATQTVQHLHVHVVPRRPGDGLTLPWTGQQ